MSDKFIDDLPDGVECPHCGTWRRITAIGTIDECSFCLDEEYHIDDKDGIELDD